MTFFELRLHVYRSFLSVYLDPKVHCVLSLYERMLHARMADTLVKVSETMQLFLEKDFSTAKFFYLFRRV